MTIVKIIAFLLIVVSVGFLIRQWRSIYGHEITMAKVTELEPVSDSEGTTYKVIARYRDMTGNEHRYRSSWSSKPPAHKIGDEFPLMYDRYDPTKCSSLTFGNRFGVFWIMLGVGLLMLWIVFGWEYGTRIILSFFPRTN